MHAEEAVERGNFAYGHYNNPFSGRLGIYDLNQANNWARHPTGYANATAGDLVRFASLLMDGGGGVLSGESTQLMQTRQRYLDLGEGQYYGYGTFIDQFQGWEMVHHDGGAWGWAATMKWIPEAGLAVATVSNIGGGIMSSSTACALEAYLTPRQPPPTPCRMDRASWDEYVGTFRGSLYSGAPWTIHVARPEAGGNLRMAIERDGADPLEAALTQDCGTWLANGAGSFQAAGIGLVTFIEDPVDTGRLWLRHRQFVASRDPDEIESIAVYLPFAGAASRSAW
jgi:hypothetical protein